MTTAHKSVKTPKSGHPKFKNLRKRLQYKMRKEERIPQCALEEEIHKTDDESLTHESEKKTKRKQKYFNRASPMKIVKLYKHQNQSHRHVITVNGFGSFLGIKCSKLHPGLCNFLMASFNTETCELEFPGRGSIPITEVLVQKVLGLPMGKFPVVYQVDEEAIAFVMATLGFGTGKQPKLVEVEKKLKGMELGDPVYFMLWVLYFVCSMLAPTTGVHICPKCYPAIMDPAKIKLLNWCRFVIVILIETTKAKGKKNAFKACMSFLMITYIDSLETKNIKVADDGPRICAWDNKSVALAIAQDTKDDVSFGVLPLKKCYRKNKVLMLSTPARIEKFVKANVPANCSHDDISRYRSATQEMYSEIDIAVANFLKKVSTKTPKAEHSQSRQKFKPSRKESSKMQNQHGSKIPSYSGSRKRQHRGVNIVSSSSSSSEDESVNPDNQYVRAQYGYETDNDQTSLDDESLDVKDYGDDDFMSTKIKRTGQHYPLNSMQHRQSASDAIQPRAAKRKFHKSKEGVQEKIMHTQAIPIQTREPPNYCVAETKISDDVPLKTRVRKRELNKKRKAANPSEICNTKKNRLDSKTSKQSVTQIATIGSQGFREEGIQVESKSNAHQVDVIDSLEQIKLYASDSLSSIDAGRSEVQANRVKLQGVTAANEPEKQTPQSLPEGTEGCSKLPEVVTAASEANDISPILAGMGGCLRATGCETAASEVNNINAGCAGNQSTCRNSLDGRIECSNQPSNKLSSQSKKAVSWADQQDLKSADPPNLVERAEVVNALPIQNIKEQSETNSPGSILRSRPVTRSMSSFKQMISTKESSSPVTRSISSANPLLVLKEGLSTNTKRHPLGEVDSPARASKLVNMEANCTPAGKNIINLEEDSMSRKLIFDSFDHDDPRRRWVPGEAPSFSVGFDEPPSKARDYTVDPVTGIPVITSSNEDDFYGPAEDYEKLAVQMGETFFPMKDTCSSGPSKRNEHAQSTTATTPFVKLKEEVKSEDTVLYDPDSKTPVPQPHQKRVIKPARAQVSPFMPYDKKNQTNVSRSVVDVYNAVCKHVAKSESGLKEEVIIDYGATFIYLQDLADSVAPGGWLSNSACEVALHVLSQEVASQKKFVMPLVIADKLREGSFHTKDVKKVFAFSETNRLDHKEQIMFPVLQNLSSIKKFFCGHYYLINLNLKAERFEVMDSMRNVGNKSLMADCSKIIDSVKAIWATNYKLSSIKIEDYETIYIQTPKQLTTFDCGYFVLKFIECWDGRKLVAFNARNMPNFRMQFTKKWLEWVPNYAPWHELLFKN